MPSGREQSQLISPQASRLISQTVCYQPAHCEKSTNKNSFFKEKLHQMCREELSHHVQHHGPSVSSHSSFDLKGV